MPLLALCFVSAMKFILERTLIDLVPMGARTILLWSGGAAHIHTPFRKRADNTSKAQN
jgi:hypothetical protein